MEDLILRWPRSGPRRIQAAMDGACILRGSPRSSRGSHLRMRKMIRVARTPDLILRWPRSGPRRIQAAMDGACILRGSPDKSGSRLRMRNEDSGRKNEIAFPSSRWGEGKEGTHRGGGFECRYGLDPPMRRYHPAVAAASGASARKSLATKRLPVTPSDLVLASHRSGGTMMAGSSKLARESSGKLLGIMPVSVAPPGNSALTVTPLPARSCAQMMVADSSAALDGP